MTLSRAFLFLFLVAAPMFLFAQIEEQPIEEASTKSKEEVLAETNVAKYARMKQNGYILLGVGLGSLGGGIALMSTGKWDETRTGTSVNYQAKDGKAGIGLVLTLAGLPITIVGAILASRGTKRHRYWEEKLYVTTSQVRDVPTLGLGYKF